jgi:precorrin-6B methylase 2
VGYTFFATFIPGLGECIAGFIRERLPDAKIHRLLDGAALFETQCAYDKLNFFCFNNIFAVINIMDHREDKGALEKHIQAVIAKAAGGKTGLQNFDPADGVISHNSGKFRTFRIVASRENKPAAIDEKLKIAAERYISRLSGLAVNRAGPDTEFWFLYRRESGLSGPSFSCFMKRLTLRPSWEKSLRPGELPPPLAWTLCRLAGLKHGDTVLDPFCGCGSIPEAALKYFHITRFIACDRDKKAAAGTRARFKNRTGASFMPRQADFRSLVSSIPEKSVDAVVTDPPWGLYREYPIGQLYEEMFRVFEKLLKENGRLVILCAPGEELINAAAGRFELQKEIPILLSGKKTGIFIMKSPAEPMPARQ